MNSDQTKKIVLVVDDSADALDMLNESLVGAGYTVFVAMDGIQALAIAERMSPDIVLMDAVMPNMDGFTACKALKSMTLQKEVPVIFMTGLGSSEDVVKGLEAGGVDYVSKPIHLDELLARIKVHLTNSQMTKSARCALDEIGHLSFTCDVNGKMVWSTTNTRQLLQTSCHDESWLLTQLPEQIKTWLTFQPEKNNVMSLRGLNKPLQAKFIGRPTDSEYLFRLLDNDELVARSILKNRFDLTVREAEVLFWLSRGKTNREIGQILSMSPRTVNKHLEPVYRKLSVENRTTAVAVCLQYIGN